MGQQQYARTPSAAQGAQPEPAAPAEGLGAYGNAAAAEQVPPVSAPGEATYGLEDPAWAAPLEEDGVAAAGAGGQSPLAVFRAELASPDPDPNVVYRALRDMAIVQRARIYEDRATWAIVEGILPLEQLAELVPAIRADRNRVTLEDPGVRAAIAALHPVLEEHLLGVIELELGEMFRRFDEVERGQRFVPVGIRERKFTELGDLASRLLGVPGATVEMGADTVVLYVSEAGTWPGGLVPTITASAGDFVWAHLHVDHPVFGVVSWTEGFSVPSFTARDLGLGVAGGPSTVRWAGPDR